MIHNIMTNLVWTAGTTVYSWHIAVLHLAKEALFLACLANEKEKNAWNKSVNVGVLRIYARY